MCLAHMPKNCKAHPDEKGIETALAGLEPPRVYAIAKHIPTKRELKPVQHILNCIRI